MSAALSLALAAAAPAALPACTVDQLSLATDGENGAFNGMSHSGTLLVVRNLGSRTCTLPALPHLQFFGPGEVALPVVQQAPPGLHSAPVARPVPVAAGAELTAPLRWVSGPVYPQSRCLSPTELRVEIAGGVLRSPLSAHICGPTRATISFEQPALRPDPALPAASPR